LFHLIISIINMNENATTKETPDGTNNNNDDNLNLNKFSYLNDILLSQHGSSKRTSSTCSTPSLSTSPSSHLNGLPKDPTTTGVGVVELDLDDNDEYVYKKINAKCKALFRKLNPFCARVHASAAASLEFNFNSQLLSLDCLLNLDKHTRNLLLNESYKSQLRELKILDKIVVRLQFIVNLLTSNVLPSGENNGDDHDDSWTNYLLEKFISCFNLLQTVTQTTTTMATSTSNGASRLKPSRKVLSICDKAAEPHETPDFVLNQLYLIDFKQKSLVSLIKQ
jgi:hypothetical protein